MIDLNRHKTTIADFLNTSIKRFHREYNKPKSIGVYCCTSSGWISLNYNVNISISEADKDCLNFEYVEFDISNIPGLQDEYEKNTPQLKINNSIIAHDHSLGDERLNLLVFGYLKEIILEIKPNWGMDFLLQMLDSNLVEEI